MRRSHGGAKGQTRQPSMAGILPPADHRRRTGPENSRVFDRGESRGRNSQQSLVGWRQCKTTKRSLGKPGCAVSRTVIDRTSIDTVTSTLSRAAVCGGWRLLINVRQTAVPLTEPDQGPSASKTYNV